MTKINSVTTPEEPWSCYGFVESVSKRKTDSPYERMNIVFDAVDKKAFDATDVLGRESEHLSIIRIMSTPKRLLDISGIHEKIEGDIEEGDWFEITLANEINNPRAWVLYADKDYGGEVVNTNLIGFRRIRGRGTHQFTVIAKKLTTWCRFTPTQNRSELISDQKISLLSKSPHVRIVDVGHANFAAIHVNNSKSSTIIGYFDVGGPVFFHHQTFPKTFNENPKIPKKGFVALSHWDFDHYSLAVTKLKKLQDLTWYAPDQDVGPNAAKLQSLLGSRLNLLTNNIFHISNELKLFKALGASWLDRNNSGYVLTVKGNGGITLLTGDVAYNNIPPAAISNLCALAVTHHGGSGCGTPPLPLYVGAKAAVSYGLPNRYKHPDMGNIQAHTNVGWTVNSTFTSAIVRGDVWLP